MVEKETIVRLLDAACESEAMAEMERIGVDPAGIALMLDKQFHYNFALDGLSSAAANILKQEALSVGAEAAVAKGVVSCSVESTGCVLSGTEKQLVTLSRKLSAQPYGLKRLARSLEQALGNIKRGARVFKGRTRSWDLRQGTLIMGVLNVTPDSFSDGGLYSDAKKALVRGLEMAAEGADIIDVGGESTRPGAAVVTEQEELKRVLPVVEGLSNKGIAVSIDTTKAAVAEAALKAGAEIVNDVSAGTRDEGMPDVLRKIGPGVILMHMRGTPETMQGLARYNDLMGEVYGYLKERVEAIEGIGLERVKIAVDPGIGFAKGAEASVEIIKRLREFGTLGVPIVIGASRKSFIPNTLGKEYEGAGERVVPTLAATCAAVMNGASVVRVHDVKEAKAAVAMTDAIIRGGRKNDGKRGSGLAAV